MLISFILDLADGVIDFIAFDTFNLNILDISIGVVPVSLLSLSMWSTVFGALGLCLSRYLSQTTATVVAVTVGYLFAVVVQTIIIKLKKVKNNTESTASILDRKATVCNTIKENGYGTVSFSKPDGSVVSFPSRSSDGLEIQQGTEVTVDSFKNGVVFVKRKD